MANCADPDQTAPTGLLRVYTVCLTIFFPIFGVSMVVSGCQHLEPGEGYHSLY